MSFVQEGSLSLSDALPDDVLIEILRFLRDDNQSLDLRSFGCSHSRFASLLKLEALRCLYPVDKGCWLHKHQVEAIQWMEATERAPELQPVKEFDEENVANALISDTQYFDNVVPNVSRMNLMRARHRVGFYKAGVGLGKTSTFLSFVFKDLDEWYKVKPHNMYIPAGLNVITNGCWESPVLIDKKTFKYVCCNPGDALLSNPAIQSQYAVIRTAPKTLIAMPPSQMTVWKKELDTRYKSACARHKVAFVHSAFCNNLTKFEMRRMVEQNDVIFVSTAQMQEKSGFLDWIRGHEKFTWKRIIFDEAHMCMTTNVCKVMWSMRPFFIWLTSADELKIKTQNAIARPLLFVPYLNREYSKKIHRRVEKLEVVGILPQLHYINLISTLNAAGTKYYEEIMDMCALYTQLSCMHDRYGEEEFCGSAPFLASHWAMYPSDYVATMTSQISKTATMTDFSMVSDPLVVARGPDISSKKKRKRESTTMTTAEYMENQLTERWPKISDHASTFSKGTLQDRLFFAQRILSTIPADVSQCAQFRQMYEFSARSGKDEIEHYMLSPIPKRIRVNGMEPSTDFMAPATVNENPCLRNDFCKVSLIRSQTSDKIQKEQQALLSVTDAKVQNNDTDDSETPTRVVDISGPLVPTSLETLGNFEILFSRQMFAQPNRSAEIETPSNLAWSVHKVTNPTQPNCIRFTPSSTPTGRYDGVMRVLSSPEVQDGDRIVMFLRHCSNITLLTKFLKANTLASLFLYDTTLDIKHRTESLAKFESCVSTKDKPAILLTTYRIGGVGLNLQNSANHVVFVEPTSNTEMNQAIGRLHRQGQRKEVYAWTLEVQKTYDEHYRNNPQDSPFEHMHNALEYWLSRQDVKYYRRNKTLQTMHPKNKVRMVDIEKLLRCAFPQDVIHHHSDVAHYSSPGTTNQQKNARRLVARAASVIYSISRLSWWCHLIQTGVLDATSLTCGSLSPVLGTVYLRKLSACRQYPMDGRGDKYGLMAFLMTYSRPTHYIEDLTVESLLQLCEQVTIHPQDKLKVTEWGEMICWLKLFFPV